MERVMLKSKIHGAYITQTELHYEGSITIDEDLLEAADILPNEQVQVVNLNNGARFITYAIKGERGSGIIGLNGPAARLGVPGDKVIILTYCPMDSINARTFEPKIVIPNSENKIKKGESI